MYRNRHCPTAAGWSGAGEDWAGVSPQAARDNSRDKDKLKSKAFFMVRPSWICTAQCVERFYTRWMKASTFRWEFPSDGRDSQTGLPVLSIENANMGKLG